MHRGAAAAADTATGGTAVTSSDTTIVIHRSRSPGAPASIVGTPTSKRAKKLSDFRGLIRRHRGLRRRPKPRSHRCIAVVRQNLDCLAHKRRHPAGQRCATQDGQPEKQLPMTGRHFSNKLNYLGLDRRRIAGRHLLSKEPRDGRQEKDAGETLCRQTSTEKETVSKISSPCKERDGNKTVSPRNSSGGIEGRGGDETDGGDDVKRRGCESAKSGIQISSSKDPSG
ncbi:hypothetical protein EVAR_82173_1 [Eumeta japonica]|uniref:Uncharacterized protein n=1 Tax=Eumeta variegata TaxID=151549 RepID=A0A4C1U222_EUMVA|nr:hypothetical protein EVAR_82173_1 [Eumeta japonica]